MAHINFTFERWETDAPHGFELGDLTVATDSRSVTSKGRIPDAKMMIYISMADLISGVAALLRGNSRQYEFVGVDSSFSLSFKRTKRGVELKQGTKELGLFDRAPWPPKWRPTLIASGTLTPCLQTTPFSMTSKARANNCKRLWPPERWAWKIEGDFFFRSSPPTPLVPTQVDSFVPARPLVVTQFFFVAHTPATADSH
jgi:hypothetical protein